MSQITKLVLDKLIERLAESSVGFNANHAAVAATYGVEPVVIDFDFGASHSLFKGGVQNEAWLRAAGLVFPAMTVYPRSSAHQAIMKAHVFSGRVYLGVSVWLEWLKDRSRLQDFTAGYGAVEDAMYATIQTMANMGHWVGAMIYANDLGCVPGALAQDENGNWFQGIHFSLSFQVHAA